jgi:HAMP domain-containing protein
MLVLFASAPLVAYGYWTLDFMADTFEKVTLETVSGLAKAKSGAIDQFTSDRRRDVERIGQLIAPRLGALLTISAKPKPDKPPPQKLPRLQDAEALQPGKAPKPPPVLPKVEPPKNEPPKNESPKNESPKNESPKKESPKEETPDVPQTPQAPPEPSGEEKTVQQAEDELRQTLGLILWDQQEFEELLVIDATGKVLASTFKGHEQRSAADLTYFQSGLRATFVQPVFMSPITEKLTMMIATPIRDDKSQVIGVLAARLNLSRFFLVINDLTGLGATGESVVGKLVENKVVLMAPTRHDAQAALKRTVEVGSPDARPIQDAARGQGGQGVVTDYRGVCVFAAWQHIPALEWGMVTKVDCDEAMGPVHDARRQMLLVAVALGALALLAALLAASAFVRPLRTLQDATDRISRGDVDVQIDIPPGDEMGDLADSFERMVAAIKFFRERSEEDDEEVIPEDTSGG